MSARHGGIVADRGWKRPFDDPIALPNGRALFTLEDAGAYITELPKADHQLDEWQAAIESLMLVVELVPFHRDDDGLF